MFIIYRQSNYCISPAWNVSKSKTKRWLFTRFHILSGDLLFGKTHHPGWRKTPLVDHPIRCVAAAPKPTFGTRMFRREYTTGSNIPTELQCLGLDSGERLKLLIQHKSKTWLGWKTEMFTYLTEGSVRFLHEHQENILWVVSTSRKTF